MNNSLLREYFSLKECFQCTLQAKKDTGKTVTYHSILRDVQTSDELAIQHKSFLKLDQLKTQDCVFRLQKIVSFDLMKPTDCNVVRLFSDLSRVMITRICISEKIPIYPDKSNQSLLYSRNRIRKHVIPYFQFFLNPKVEEALFRFAELAYKEQELVSRLCRQNYLSL